MSEYTRCPVCGDSVSINADRTIRVHLRKVDGVPRYGRETCQGSAVKVPR